MNLSSIGSASTVTSGFLSEPPLSPGPPPGAGGGLPQLRTVDPTPASEASSGPEPEAPVTPLAPAPPLLAPTPTPPVDAPGPDAPAAAQAPEAPPAPAAAPPTLESTLLRMRLVTPDQIASAMREEAETGRAIAEIVLANGWVSADDLARLQPSSALTPAPVAPPAPAVGVEPAAEPVAPVDISAPAPTPAAAPAAPPVAVAEEEPAAPARAPVPAAPAGPVAPAPAARVDMAARVLVRLENGERIDVGQFGDYEAAKQRARDLTAELQQATEWPFLSGRYVRPDAVVSVDIDLTGF
jgi:hypothetical protein